jgi:hypothetical protein
VALPHYGAAPDLGAFEHGVVEPPLPSSDAGQGPMDAGLNDATTSPRDAAAADGDSLEADEGDAEGGCSCSAGGRRAPALPRGSALLFLAAAALLRRRR